MIDPESLYRNAAAVRNPNDPMGKLKVKIQEQFIPIDNT
jgi:hypothetical protein